MADIPMTPTGVAPIAPASHPVPQPTIPKGSSIIIGAILSALFGFLASFVIESIWWWVFPATMRAEGFFAFVLWILEWAGGIYAGLAFYFIGKVGKIPIGFRGVPTFFDGRFSDYSDDDKEKMRRVAEDEGEERPEPPPLAFLFPEGDAWNLPLIGGSQQVNMRGRPLAVNPVDTDLDEVQIPVITKVGLPEDGDTADDPKKVADRKLAEKFFTSSVVKMAVRIRVFDPYLYLNFENVEGLLLSLVQQQARRYAIRQTVMTLPELRDEMTQEMRILDKIAAEMGTDFVKLMVTEIVPPPDIVAEGSKIPVEWIQRLKERYQAETLALSTGVLRKVYPDLDDRDLKNMVMSAAGLTTTTNVYSFEGRGAIPVITPTGGH